MPRRGLEGFLFHVLSPIYSPFIKLTAIAVFFGHRWMSVKLPAVVIRAPPSGDDEICIPRIFKLNFVRQQ